MTDPATVPAVGYFNQADACTLSGGDWSTTLPLTQLQSRDIGQVARSKRTSASANCFKAAGCSGPARFMGLLGDNFTGPDPLHALFGSEIPTWRVRTIWGGSYEANFGTFNPRSKPTAILASTNLAGVVSAVQDPDPDLTDGVCLTAVSPTADTSATFSMDGANCALLEGAGLQLVRIRVRKTAGASNPTVRIEVLEAGVLRVASSELPVTLAAPFTNEKNLSWDASVFSANPPNPDDVQIRIIGTASATSTVEIDAVEFVAEYASAGDVVVRDSGWLTRALPPNYWGPPRSNDMLYLLHDWEANYDLNEAFFEFLPGANCFDGHLQAGRLVITGGETFVDGHGDPAGAEVGWSYGWVDPSPKERTRAGGMKTSRRKRWHELDFNMPALNRASALDIALGLVDSGGTTRDMLWMIEPGVYVWGTQKELGRIVHQATSPATYSRAFSVEETV